MNYFELIRELRNEKIIRFIFNLSLLLIILSLIYYYRNEIYQEYLFLEYRFHIEILKDYIEY